MAKIMNDAAYMGFPLSIKRGNPAPVDTTAVWYNKTELETYAKSGATAYVGQILTLVTDNKCEAYMISNKAGTLIKLASTTASGDLAADVATLQGQVTKLIEAVGAKAQGETAATGLYKEIADVLAVANGKVGSVTAADKSVTIGGSVTAPTVQVAIASGDDNALTLASDGLKVVVPEVTHPEYTIVEDKTSIDYSAVYHLQKDGKNVGAAINIPKDMVVKSGSVQTYEAGSLPVGVTEAGTYIVLVLNDAAETKLYINVGNLIEYVTSGSAKGDMVFVNIDPLTHKVTATITDGTITEAKLAKAVTDKLAKAVSAVQEVKAGTANGTIAVDGADVAVTGLADAAYVTVASLNETAQNKVDAAKTELLGAEADDSTKETIRGTRKLAESSAASALTDAKTYVGAEIDKLDVEDTAVAKQFVSAVSETDGKITVERRALVADDVPELGISKISGLQDAIDAKQDVVSFDGTYSASNKAATVKTVTDAVTTVVSNGADKASDDTIKGAKLYADGKLSEAKTYADNKLTEAKTYADNKSSDALTAAKEYADGLVTGDDGIAARVDTLESKVDVTKVSTAISTAKAEAIADAATDASNKNAALKTAILGEEAYTQTVKSAYELAASKTTMAAVEAKDYATKTEAQGYADAKDTAIAAAKKAGTDAMAKIGTIPEGATATTAIGYVDEKIAAIPAQVDYSVTVDTSSPTSVAKRYVFSQKGSEIVTIDIPKDMVVESGEVVENPAGHTAGTYLVLTLANATSDKVYINVGDLIEYVTGAKATDGIITTAVDANHVLTATIGDGTIPKAKLTTAVQNSLDKANTALQAADLELYAKTADVAEGYVAKETDKRLMTTTEGTKLAGIAENAQVNVIEKINVAGAELDVLENKTVNIPLATAARAGLIKSSAAENAVAVNAETGIATVNSLNVNKLVQTAEEELILDCGHA